MLEGDNIVSAARRAIMRHDYSAVLTIFPILKHLKNSKSDFDSTLQVGPPFPRDHVPVLGSGLSGDTEHWYGMNEVKKRGGG